MRLDTTYARLLATKVGLVTVALGIAAWNRLCSPEVVTAGRYRASIALPVAGEWRVEISVQTDAFSDEVADIAVRVAG